MWVSHHSLKGHVGRPHVQQLPQTRRKQRPKGKSKLELLVPEVGSGNVCLIILPFAEIETFPHICQKKISRGLFLGRVFRER